jgi:hypothetical protein
MDLFQLGDDFGVSSENDRCCVIRGSGLKRLREIPNMMDGINPLVLDCVAQAKK